VGGSGEVLQHQRSGFLVEPKSRSQLTESLLVVLRDQALAERLGQGARKTVEAYYSLNYIVEQYIKLYNSLLSRS